MTARAERGPQWDIGTQQLAPLPFINKILTVHVDSW